MYGVCSFSLLLIEFVKRGCGYVLLEDRKSSEAERGSGVYNDLSLDYPYILLIQLSIFLLWFFFKLPQKEIQRSTTVRRPHHRHALRC